VSSGVGRGLLPGRREERRCDHLLDRLILTAYQVSASILSEDV